MSRSKTKSKKTNYDKPLFCNVNVGINECNICNCNAYYSAQIPQRKYKDLPRMELLRCGHCICQNCYNKIINLGEFNCPWCRKESVYISEGFGSNKVRGKINTLHEFQLEWHNYLQRAMMSRHPLAKLHNQIVSKYILEKKQRLKRDNLEEKRKLRKLKKKQSRKEKI